MTKGVIVLGSLNLDMVVVTPWTPAPGENICGSGFQMVAGGKGANQAVALAKLGGSAWLLGCVGRDLFGDFLIEKLEAGGIDASMVLRKSNCVTGVALISVEQGTGINTILVDPGANLALNIEDLDMLEPLYEAAGAALFQLEVPLEVVEEGSRRARLKGLKTVLDAGPPRDTTIGITGNFDVVSPNRNELVALTGEKIDGTDSVIRASGKIIAEGVPEVVVKMGDEGAVVVTGEGAWHVYPFKVRAVDATGAGDAFTAALTFALGEGIDLLEATNFACAAGAAAVTVKGAMPSMPDRKKVEELTAGREENWTRL